MYYFYFDKILFPIAPESLETKMKGSNSTITLINEGEINQIKSPKLTELSFDLLLPQINKYPFAMYCNYHEVKVAKSPMPLTLFNYNMAPASYFLEQIESIFTSKKPFKFKVVRNTPSNKTLFDTTMLVTLEEYTIKEEASNGFDIVVSVTLKRYIKYGTKKITVKKDRNKKILTKKEVRKLNKNLPATYKVKKGDTLHNIAKKYYLSGDKTYRQAIYKKNKSIIEKAAKKAGLKASANGKHLTAGIKLTIPKLKE